MFEESLLDVGVDESQFVRNVAARVDERSRDIDPTQWESDAEFSLGSRPVETLSSHQPDIATCPQREAETAGGGSVTLHNRFAPLNEAADAVSGVSRPKEFAMTEGSDTESCEFQGRLSRRLRLVWDPSVQDGDSHDHRLERVRRVVQPERRAVRDAEQSRELAIRVGPTMTTTHVGSSSRGSRMPGSDMVSFSCTERQLWWTRCS